MPKNIDFPPQPKLQEAIYAPIYVEPLLESGERICVGAVVLFEKDIQIIITDQVHRLSHLFNAPIIGMHIILKYASESLLLYLKNNNFRKLGLWSSPLGVFVGEVTSCQMPSLDATVSVALMRHCALHRYKSVDTTPTNA